MLKSFRQSSLLQIIVILLVTAILWLRAFVDPSPMATEHYFSPIYSLIQGLLATSPRLCTAITLVLIIFEAVWLNIILASNKMNKANWMMPTLLFILAISWRPEQLTLSPILLAWIPILAATTQMLTKGNTTLEVDRIFNAAFCIGVASLCYLPTIVFVIPLLLVFITYKLYRWRDFIVALLGIAAPIFILFIYAFLADKLDYFIILIGHDIVNLRFSTNDADIADIITNIFFIFILLASLFAQLSSLNDKTIQQRINTIIFILPLVATLLLLPYDSLFTVNTQFAAIPFAFLTANFLATERKRKWINETLFWLIIIAPIISLVTAIL